MVYYSMLREHFPNISINYYSELDILRIKCKELSLQQDELKKVLKILIFGIQSKLVNKNTILLEVTNSDILKEDIKILLNLLKFTKTLHYFNIITRDKVTEEVEAKISLLLKEYVGLNINKEIV